MLTRIAAAALAMLCGLVGQAGRADVTVSLHDAVRQGKVEVEVKSLGAPLARGFVSKCNVWSTRICVWKWRLARCL